MSANEYYYDSYYKDGFSVIHTAICLFFTLIFILNMNNPRYRLPELVLRFTITCYVLFQKLTFFKVFKIGLMAGLFTLVSKKLFDIAIKFFELFKGFHEELFFSIVFLGVLLIITLITEAAEDPLSRSLRKFFFWLILFTGVLSLTIYQIKAQLSTSNINEMNIVSLLLGLFFSFALVLDKGREAYQEILKNKDIQQKIEAVKNEYWTYEKMKKIIVVFSLDLVDVFGTLKYAIKLKPIESLSILGVGFILTLIIAYTVYM